MDKRSSSLCYTKNGLINPETLNYITENKIEEVILFGDGSSESFDHISKVDISSFGPSVVKIGLGKTPIYEMRVISQDGNISKPAYMYDEDIKTKWMCAKVCAPWLELYISSTTDTGNTQAQLNRKLTETVCYMGYRLWNLMLILEEKYAFPAAIIDALATLTYFLTPETMDIKRLREETGIHSLTYNSDTDLLSVEIVDDVFIIKLEVLNNLYGKLILPFFSRIYGRKWRLRGVVKTLTSTSDIVDLTYGEIGRLVYHMKMYAREILITNDNPISPADLLQFAKKVKIDDETCLWIEGNKPIKDVLESSYDLFVRNNITEHQSGEYDSQ